MYSILSNSGNLRHGQKEYLLDTELDVDSLPTDCEPGSKAFVIETSQTYMLNNQHEWKLISTNSGSGGGSLPQHVIYDGGYA